jgi:putative ABC transport system permease protein
MSTVSRVRAVEDVERADPVISRFAVLGLHGQRQFLSVIGYTPGGLGGPWRIADGRRVEADDEAVVDRVLANEHDVDVGDTVDVMGARFRVVGLSAGTRSFMTGYVFITHATAQRAFGIPGQTSLVLVQTKDPVAVERQLRSVPGVSSLDASGFAEKTRLIYARVIAPIINLMILIAFAAGTIIVALTVYSAVVERLREYGITRALGARSARLFRIVLGQTLMLAVLGIVSGYGMFWLFGWIMTTLRPKFWLVISPRDVVRVVFVALFMALIAALFPTRRLTRLDPASVYREGSS